MYRYGCYEDNNLKKTPRTKLKNQAHKFFSRTFLFLVFFLLNFVCRNPNYSELVTPFMDDSKFMNFECIDKILPSNFLYVWILKF